MPELMAESLFLLRTQGPHLCTLAAWRKNVAPDSNAEGLDLQRKGKESRSRLGKEVGGAAETRKGKEGSGTVEEIGTG